MNKRDPVADQTSIVMVLARLARVADDGGPGSEADLQKAVMHGRGGEEHRDRRPLGPDLTVAQDNKARPGPHRGLSCIPELLQPRLQPLGAGGDGEPGLEQDRLKGVLRLEPGELRLPDNG